MQSRARTSGEAVRWGFLVVLMVLACATPPPSELPEVDVGEVGEASEAAAPDAPSNLPLGPSSFYSTKVYELVLRYPPPLWVETPEDATATEYDRKQAGREFVLDQRPAGETPATWTRLYGLYGVYAQELGFTKWKERVLGDWVAVCAEGQLGVQAIVDELVHWLGLVVCGETPGGKPDAGLGPEVGVVVLIDAQRMSDTYVRLLYVWRGARFDVRDTASWPASEAEIRQMLARFDTLVLEYDPDAPSLPVPR